MWMKPHTSLLLLATLPALPLAAQDAVARAPRAAADFTITADPSSPAWRNVPAHRAGVDPMG
jgi:hypothetical protein